MGTPRYQQLDPFHEHSTHSPTAYQGAGGLGVTPTLRIENNRFEDVRLSEDHSKTAPTATTREGLGSRLLSSLANAQPAAAALSRSGSVLHSRARSWAAAYTAPERSPSPTKGKFIDNLFSGESGKVRLGVPTSPIKEKEEAEAVMEYRPVLTERPDRPRLRQHAPQTTVNTAPSNNRKTSWFTRKAGTPVTPVVRVEDEMSNMNINTALFPHGPADPLSPQAFNDLLLNATNLIQRMQAAYKEKADYLASIQPEIDAQKEEVEEAKTRSAHLKMQLEDTARQAQEQRVVNEELLLKFTEERMKVQRLQEERSQTIRLVHNNDTEPTTADEDSSFKSAQHKRSSRGSASDSGFESDADTASVLSSGVETPTSQHHHHTPRFSALNQTLHQLDHRIDLRYVPSRGSALSQQSTAFSRNEGIAWATVEKLRNENSDLKARVEDLQRGYDGVLDFVDGLRET